MCEGLLEFVLLQYVTKVHLHAVMSHFNLVLCTYIANTGSENWQFCGHMAIPDFKTYLVNLS